MVRQIAGVRPEPGTAYSAVTLDNGDLVLTEAHSVDPSNTAIDNDTTDRRTDGHTMCRLYPPLQRRIKKLPEVCFLTYLSTRPVPLFLLRMRISTHPL